jgi:hypothetical protein
LWARYRSRRPVMSFMTLPSEESGQVGCSPATNAAVTAVLHRQRARDWDQLGIDTQVAEILLREEVRGRTLG